MSSDFQYFQAQLFSNRRTLEYVTDKSKSSESIINYMLARLQKMFKYTNLPDTIPRQYLENYLLVNGHCILAPEKKSGKVVDPSRLYAFVGAPGGEPDIYYRPTKYMVANPSLQFSAEYYISDTDPNHERDAILIRNDTMWQGLYPMMARYAALISENLLTLRTADVMLRVLALITAPDDKSKAAADEYLKNIVDGKLASISENRFLDGIRMQNPPSNNGSYLTQFIELHQYLVGSFYNEVGLNANYNMKREALSESETGLNDDSLMPLCEDMLRCRREDFDAFNQMFGEHVEVDFDSSWLENVIERSISLRIQAQEASSQLDDPAPMEAGMESVGIEGASMEGAGMEDVGGPNENGDDGSKNNGMEDETLDENREESTGDVGSNNVEETGSEEPGEEEGNNDSNENDGNENLPDGAEDGQTADETDGDQGSGNVVDGNIEVKVDVIIDGKAAEDEKSSEEKNGGEKDEQSED